MLLIFTGAGLMLASLALLLAMVARGIEPSLVLSLLAYAALVAGMLIAAAGAARRLRRRSRNPG